VGDETLIPDVWRDMILERLREQGEFLAMFPLPDLPPMTRRQRLRSWFRRWRDHRRERTALRIAPWLEREDY
jgi:hypothetical protein